MAGVSDTPDLNTEGMPKLSFDGKTLSHFEFWSGPKFYWPIWLYFIYLSIRFRGLTLITAANPSFPFGGLVGESKSKILGIARDSLPDLIPDFIVFDRLEEDKYQAAERALNISKRQSIKFPFVMKPDLGCRGAGVQKICNQDELVEYLDKFPANGKIIIQELADDEGEAGIFYARNPQDESGQVISVTLKYFPYVYGDGIRTLRTLISEDPRASQLPQIYLKRFSNKLDSVPLEGQKIRLAFAGNHSKGTIFRNGNALITKKLDYAFDEVAKKIPGFYFGRIDIRFSDLQRVLSGERDFKIIEINGAGSEATHIWDSRTTLSQAWHDVRCQFRLAWEIGAINRSLGHQPNTLLEIYRAWQTEKKLAKNYPPTL